MPDIQLVELEVISAEESSSLRQALSFWEGLLGEKAYPTRRDIDPTAIISLLPSVLILDVVDAGSDFKYRIHSAGVSSISDFSFQGKLVSDIKNQRPPSTIHSLYFRTYSTGKPVCARIPYVGSKAKVKHIDCIAMPLSDDGKEVTGIFTIADLSKVNKSGL